MHRLADFQKAFGAALRGDEGAVAPWLAPTGQAAGLAVYRNTVTRGSIDVLVATFGTVVRIVGEEWFRAAAAVYVAEQPPTTPSMLRYGAGFAQWLSAFPPAQDTPYLPAIADLDRLWWDAYFADEAECLAPEALASLDEGSLNSTALALHPSVRLAAFDQNLAGLWLSQRDDATAAEFEIASTPEAIVIVRRGLQVEVGDHLGRQPCLSIRLQGRRERRFSGRSSPGGRSGRFLAGHHRSSPVGWCLFSSRTREGRFRSWRLTHVPTRS